MSHSPTFPFQGGDDPLTHEALAPRPPAGTAAVRDPASGQGAAPRLEPWLLRPEEAAQLLAVSRATVYALLASGDLPSIAINRCRRIPVEALRAWLATRLD